jgi:acetylornithine/succinyldiaminopimelate/putrescine aminotransferase
VSFDDVAALDAAVTTDVAAVLLEAVQGEGGVQPASVEYLRAAREICTERGVLLMIDEVQTGLGRCGDWFAHQAAGIRPDVVSMAKALGNGVPIGACWATAEAAASFRPGDHATTYGGQPLATAAARRVLEVMRREDVPALARRAGARFASGLEGEPGVVGVRGRGLLLAVELEVPAGEVAADLLAAGVVVNAVTPTAIRLAPSLLVTDDEVDLGVSALLASIARVAERTGESN